MKAQVFYEAEKMKLEEIEVPAINSNEVLIKVKACGICGSDLAYFFGRTPLDTKSGMGPLVLGHEFSGVICKVGENVKNYKIGDRVTVNPPLPCNACDQCRKGNPNLCENSFPLGTAQNGAYAEYVKAPYEHVFQIPPELGFEEAAIMEPFACAMRGVQKLDVKPGETVAIFGAGSIGLMMLQLIKSSGAGRIMVSDISDFSLETARELGANRVVNTQNENSPYYQTDLSTYVRDFTQGKMIEKVIVPTGALSAMQQALAVSGKKSNVVFFGLPGANAKLEIPMLQTLQMEKTLQFSWLAPLMWPSAIQAIKEKKVDLKRLITHQFKLEDLETAIRMIDARKQNVIKSIVVFSD